MMDRKALILVNTGTPDTPAVKDVRRFLSAFLNDRRVIDLSWIARKILVNLIIVPFRSPRSAALYRQLWTADGSPLLVNLGKLVSGLRKVLGESCDVTGAMRYGNPSLEKAFKSIAWEGYDEIIVFPLYPHYASSTTGSVHELVMRQASRLNVIPSVKFISQYWSHPSFIEAWTDNLGRYSPGSFDHILFSYHGLPLRQVAKVHPGIACTGCSCSESMPDHGKFCYRATCYETTRLIAARLSLAEGSFSTAFQSRLTRNWLSPFTDHVLAELASQGKKRVLVVPPSFTADCLETVVEIGHEYKSLFEHEGGEELVMAESLNDSLLWMKAIAEIAELKTDSHDLV
jgi:protoporphyrin/coproporphyrin ferrochelatase